jgi:hypothetical protein
MKCPPWRPSKWTKLRSPSKTTGRVRRSQPSPGREKFVSAVIIVEVTVFTSGDCGGWAFRLHLGTMPKFFTLQQAEKILPDVEAAIREAIFAKNEYDNAEAERQDVSRRVAVLGGVQVDRSRVMEQKQRQDRAARSLQQTIERVHDFGCLVKDLDIGLIDFPALFRGEEVYLCWKLGEPGIQFWHGVSEGFRGRKPIDSGFLEHLRGEVPN